MNEIKDHYATLGLLPSAEDFLVQAACRALANRYRRKSWMLQPEMTCTHLAAIHEAHEVLTDPARRAVYDKAYNAIDEHDLDDEEPEFVFDEALAELEPQWLVAVNTFPDLKSIRAGLRQRSCCLEFSFVVTLLEKKCFKDRVQIAKQLESEFMGWFLLRYGSPV